MPSGQHKLITTVTSIYFFFLHNKACVQENNRTWKSYNAAMFVQQKKSNRFQFNDIKGFTGNETAGDVMHHKHYTEY